MTRPGKRAAVTRLRPISFVAHARSRLPRFFSVFPQSRLDVRQNFSWRTALGDEERSRARGALERPADTWLPLQSFPPPPLPTVPGVVSAREIRGASWIWQRVTCHTSFFESNRWLEGVVCEQLEKYIDLLGVIVLLKISREYSLEIFSNSQSYGLQSLC